MLTKDDKDWLALLEGKEVPDAHPDTLEEVRALKTALHTELQWQKLQRRIQADKAKKSELQSQPNTQSQITEWFKKLWEPISGWWHWKPLALGTAYTIVVIAVTLQITLSFLHIEDSESLPKSEELTAKSSPTTSSDTCSSNPFLRLEIETEQKALKMKQLFESAGVTEVSYQKINDMAFYLGIELPDKPSQELLDLLDVENINPDCPVNFIFIAPGK
ncbi:hypothetical protein BGP_2032 [Beggiatoa sp. PS]|nr:hypothetical protein BGP_2032 [Beggiatoa sp. PS]